MNIILSNDEYSIYFQLTKPKYSFIYLELFEGRSTRFIVNPNLNFKENIKLIEECVNKKFNLTIEDLA